jgi:hypothetical protein
LNYIQVNFLTTISIYLEKHAKTIVVHVGYLKNNKLIKRAKKEFILNKDGSLSLLLINYVYTFTKRYSYTYVSYIFDAGIFNVLLEQDYSKNMYKKFKSDNYYMQFHKFHIFCNKEDIDENMSLYKPILIDYVYSPYSILYYIDHKHKYLDIGSRVIVLVLDTSISAVIIKSNNIVAYYTHSLLTNNISGSNVMLELDKELKDEFTEADNMESLEDDQISKIQDFIIDVSHTVVDYFYNSVAYKDEDDLVIKIDIYDNLILNDRDNDILDNNLIFEYEVTSFNLVQNIHTMIKESIWN